MKVWIRLGISVDVDEQKFNESPSEAVLLALKEGKAFIDGDSYIPEKETNGEIDLSLPNIKIGVLKEEVLKEKAKKRCIRGNRFSRIGSGRRNFRNSGLRQTGLRQRKF